MHVSSSFSPFTFFLCSPFFYFIAHSNKRIISSNRVEGEVKREATRRNRRGNSREKKEENLLPRERTRCRR
jgi:hypothetical protein